MKQVMLIVFSIILLSSCKKDTQMVCTCVPMVLGDTTMYNVSYGTDPAQKMDVYLPIGRSVGFTPVIIMVHGGAWSEGDKNDMNAFVDTMKSRFPGYAVMNINYRLASVSGNTFPTQENDVNAATNFIYSKRNDYAVSDKLIMLGVSAGAHLSLLEAYKYSTPKITAVVDFFGPTDLADMYYNPASSQSPPVGIALLLNGIPPSPLYTSSSPISFVSAQSPPTLIFHGGADSLVRPQQSITLDNALIADHVPQQYVFYPAEGHGWYDANLADSFEKISEFLTTYVP